MNEHLCKQAYYDIVEFTARLAAYCTSSLADVIGHGEYEDRAQELAIRDSIFLCISARRLVELTKQYDLIKRLKIRCVCSSSGDKTSKSDPEFREASVWEIVGNFIHAKVITIIKDDATLHITIFGRPEDHLQLFDIIQNRKSVEGIYLIESDRGDVKMFNAKEFVKTIVAFTDAMDDFLADNHIFVGSEYR